MPFDVKVKWNKSVFDLVLDENQPIGEVKKRLIGLSGVPLERQKLIVKGTTLKVLFHLLTHSLTHSLTHEYSLIHISG